MKLLKRIGLIVLVPLLLIIVLAFHWVLPHHAVVHITGVEVKRADHNGIITARNPADGPTRDIYFIDAETPEGHEPRVYRNDDTRFGFPWYFKFDAADQQARAQSLARDGQQLALITYYGWRLQLFSSFPNILSIRPTDSPEPPFPWFNTIFIGVLIAVLLYLFLLLRHWSRERRLRRGR